MYMIYYLLNGVETKALIKPLPKYLAEEWLKYLNEQNKLQNWNLNHYMREC